MTGSSRAESLRPANWQLIERKLHCDCRIYKVWRDLCEHPDGRTGEFFAIDAPDWVMVLPFTVEGDLILVRQYRFGNRRLCWELPAGVMDFGEDPLTAARRELFEETGFNGGRFQSLGSLSPNPALFGNRMHFVVAENLSPGDTRDLDHHEEIEWRRVSWREFESWMASGKIDHSLVLAAAMRWKLSRKHDFDAS